MLKKFVENQFKKGLIVKVGKKLAKEIMELYASIYQKNAYFLVDKPTVLNLALTSMTLATYQHLKNLAMPDEQIKEIIRYVLIYRTQKQQQSVMKVLLKIWKDPFQKIVATSKSKQAKMYGDQNFHHLIVKHDKQVFEHHVTKCFFFNFFQANGVPELTSIFCETDNIWGDLLNDGPYGVKFDRPSLISAGAPSCHFIFTKVE